MTQKTNIESANPGNDQSVSKLRGVHDTHVCTKSSKKKGKITSSYFD